MGLDIPELDDREYSDIVEDAKKLIPVHSPEWTDHNAHDPGITFLEMLAWLAETYIYQLDWTDETHVRKYLEMMGVRPQPPQSAVAHLAVGLPEGVGTKAKTIPAGQRLHVDDGTGPTHLFETTTETTVTRATIARVISEHRSGTTDNSNANATDGLHFLAFGAEAEQGSVMYLGIDDNPFPETATTLDITVDFHEDNLPDPAIHGDETSTFEPTVEIAWQHCTDPGAWYDDDSWTDVTVIRDETNQLYRGGTVSLEKPSGWDSNPIQILTQEKAFHWIRCVVTERREKTEPMETLQVCEGTRSIRREHQNANLNTEQQHEIPPQLDTVRLNVVEARHRVAATKAEEEPLARADGGNRTTAWPEQTFVFEQEPILEADIEVTDPDATGTQASPSWKQVEDFDVSGPDDRHYMLNKVQGAIQFGDGIRGTVPEAGQIVEPKSYEYGGGTTGNVSLSSDWRFLNKEYDDLTVTALGDATGGHDEESVKSALTRLKRDMKVPYRAVTASDYRYAATHTPGLRFGRARAIVERGEMVEDCNPHDEVRVVVVPFSTQPRPEPSRGFLEAVRCHVKHHALLTDQVTVVPPTYVDVSVDAEVRLVSGYTVEGRTTAVETALDEFLDPLDGFDGDGWPFGRPLYTSEVYGVVEKVEGVDCVLDVSLTARGEYTIDTDGNVQIDDSALFVPADHDIAVRTERDQCRRGI